ncbi:aconitase X swivel domain-containing protein [Streptomyces sp. TS71-3]|uniref:aconitase X swivel domain-containing protein n=1 Tax=Streptomyces sp. TS71-3 TaxID=2733862 RepID=UPI001B04EBFC|nr:DUF126 domain-containing protein [Streptomyces sp. TS71-3]GHJ34781.1 hypothetical protein Sm713_03900 [Streptomyces sp. TS71-3]
MTPAEEAAGAAASRTPAASASRAPAASDAHPAVTPPAPAAPDTGAPAPFTLHGRKVVGGVVEGEALVSRETISGWGGIDPATGTVTERRHELFGVCFTGKILVFPGAKGSSGWSGFFQATRLLGTAPLGMIFTVTTTKSALGAVVTRVPALTDLDRDPVAAIRTGDWLRLDADHGIVTVTPRAAREAERAG